MKKIKVAIVGTGNIGTDLLIKVQRSAYLECGLFSGRSNESEGIKIAKKMNIKTSVNSYDAIWADLTCCEIIFDATSAATHIANADMLKKSGKFVIDLTPSKIGKMCIPVINLDECLDTNEVCLITCGGQATIPIAHAISKIHPDIEYIEIVSSISSKSAGPATRDNIDEYTQATKDALIQFTKIKKAKAIIILNPAEPPLIMHNTVYAVVSSPNIREINLEIKKMEKLIQSYVPGYTITRGPVFENGKIITMVEVVGCGDYLPKYSGNLDIITCAAIKIAEEYAKKVHKK